MNEKARSKKLTMMQICVSSKINEY